LLHEGFRCLRIIESCTGQHEKLQIHYSYSVLYCQESHKLIISRTGVTVLRAICISERVRGIV
jgi:hypothetical protein